MRDGAAALQQAYDEGFSDVVVIGMMPGRFGPDSYELRLFTRPRTRPVLLHIMQTADQYVQHNLTGPDGAN